MAKRKIALFGGTFDPIHLGHTRVAEAAARQIEAENVVFIPAKCSPLKGFFPNATDDDRLRMIELATRSNERFSVSDCELRRPAPSYTLDTVKHFQKECGDDASIYWLIGADSVDDLILWHRIEELIDICYLAVMVRGGYAAPSFDRHLHALGRDRVEKLRRNVIETPSIDLSSTHVRHCLAAGEDVRDMLCPDVLDYIRRHGLYRRN
ncbi:MAG: nicotinate (nicotinamide) nucleotide adenylyltransferase [Sedimentisphaerales bacterium]|jgi:nicotinate-nucleotide adenylyltransferase|nr:nicotinate (nicotinamide) nucleotide adenylyltransferase [Planctomycetota bacterium]MDY0356015.1 nicotinate (nicotinamide) nucleotide adenylyltransferase [Sedimentisphaerales bacterium]NLT76733.1 nicotinate (nicotinamide) nucleotide adenylyltransferase [Planctomycetota bacterium]